MANYSYDAWGNLVSITNNSGTDITSNTTGIAYINPIRYRGYYYDTETGFYYLQSRYYDPAIGRFISADVPTVVTDTQTVTDKNLFAYCDNNPVTRTDDGGQFWNVIVDGIVGGISSAVGTTISNAVTGKGFDLGDTLRAGAFGIVSGVLTAALPGAGAIISETIIGGVESFVDDWITNHDDDKKTT